MAVRQPKPARRYTEEEYFALGDSKPYAEYLDGVIARKAMPNLNHLDLVHEIDIELGLYCRQHGGKAGPDGRVRFEVEGRIYHRLPDLLYWAPDRPRGPIRSANPPTLAIEVRSPSETLASQREKCRFMREHGVDVCWLIDPVGRTAEVFEDGPSHILGTGGVLTTPHLPGFELNLARLFAALD
jgi:Uma2 family endonuclease